MAAIDDTVNQIITEARSFASETHASAIELTEEANRAAENSVTLSTPSLLYNQNSYTDVSVSDPGSFSGNFIRPSGKPEAPVFAPIYVPQDIEVEDAPEALDTSELFDIARPSFNIPEFAEAAPDIEYDLETPDAPTLVMPDAPTQETITLPDAPDITVPRFEASFDGILAPPPTGLAESYEAALNNAIPLFRNSVVNELDGWMAKYSPEFSTAMATLERKISEGIDGGKAMDNATEALIYETAKGRIEDEYASADEGLRKEISGRGFAAPPGVLNEISMAIRMEMTKNLAKASADVAIKRAELEHQHVQFLMSTSASLRQTMLSSMFQYSAQLVQINGQAMEHAMELNRAAVEVYKLSNEHFKTQLELFKTKADIYETELKSALADLTAYELEVKVATLRKDIEAQDLQAYTQKIAAQKVKIDMYVAQLQGVSTEANTRRLGLELYAEKIKAHALLVQAKESEFGAYRSAITGDQAKVQAYATEVSAYSAKVQAVSAQAQIENSKAATSLEANRNISEIYATELRGYLADLDAEKAIFQGDVTEYTARLDKYKVDLSAQLDELRNKYERDRLNLEASGTEFDGKLRVAVERANIQKALIQLRADTAVAAAGTLNTMAASALDGQNTMVQLVAEETI